MLVDDYMPFLYAFVPQERRSVGKCGWVGCLGRGTVITQKCGDDQ